MQVSSNSTGSPIDSGNSDSAMNDNAQTLSNHSSRQWYGCQFSVALLHGPLWFSLKSAPHGSPLVCRVHLPPTFGSAANLEALDAHADRHTIEDGDSVVHSMLQFSR